jgi:hypothetical protein
MLLQTNMDRSTDRKGVFLNSLPCFNFRAIAGDSEMENFCECGCSEVVKNRFVSGHNRRGKIHTKETKVRMSITAKERGITEETRAKMIKALTGRKLSEDHKQKIAFSVMKPRTDEYCDAWSDQEYKEDCKKTYCETCGITRMMHLKISGKKLIPHHIDGNKANCHPDNFKTLCNSCHTKYHNMQEWNRKARKPMSEETKRKISKAQKGRMFTDEHRKKISIAHRRNQ